MSRPLTLALFIVLAGSATELLGQVHRVAVLNYKFEPRELHVQPGDTVIWESQTSVIHTVTSGSSCREDGKFNSGNMGENDIFQFVFDSTGTYPYFCIPHCEMDMVGVVYVGDVDMEEGVQEYADLFSGSRVISGHSVETLRKGFLDFRVDHRWDDLASGRTSGHMLWGLDNMRDVKIGFEYGITHNLMVGVSRSRGDCCNPDQRIRELLEFFSKYRIFQQHPEGMPFSLTAFANTGISIMKSAIDTTRESYFTVKSERFSYVGQVLAARKFFNKLSLQVMPTYVRRNWALNGNEKDLFALGAGAKYQFTDLFSILIEYYHVMDDFRNQPQKVYYDPLGIAVEFDVGLHVFHLNLTNSTGLIPNTFIPYTMQKWSDGEFRLGFTISRKFHL